MTWKERLIKEAIDIAQHGHGKMELQIQEREGNKISILIIAGKTYRFLVPKEI